MASLKSDIDRLNDRMRNIEKQLGKESALYQRYASTITAMFAGKKGVISIGKAGAVRFNTGKNAQKVVTKEKVKEIRDFMNKNSLQSELKKMRDDFAKKQVAAGVKNPKKKMTLKQQHEMATRKLDSNERFRQLVDFVYENGKDENAAKAKKALSIVGKSKGKKSYAVAVEFAKEVVNMRNEMLERGEVPGEDFVDFAVFDEVLTGGDLF